ncbi:MAG: hypothetical protein RML40_04265 [Bacteroidota bacterium]|nr:hypothetical protein [Candidatus Kapabacteria bacterium]MDW8219727.1 hypothetical protein [Bacteroidota bacterium]
MYKAHIPYRNTVLTMLACCGLLSLWGNGCRPINSPTDIAEEVLPNEVTITLTSPQGNVTAVWRSTTDVKGTPTRIDTLVLAAGRTYTGTIKAVNTTKNPPIDLTAEYKKEADKHQFFYTVSGEAQGRVTITITDRDKNNLPVGLEFTVMTTSGGQARGALNVVLGHYDSVRKTGTNRAPESDMDITFPLVIR